jgi:membrane protease YdiL (CAAX protease family)
VRVTPLAKTLLFLALAAVAVLGYLFLLNVLSGKMGAFSQAVPAVVLALMALVLNWRFLLSDGSSLGAIGFGLPLFRLAQTVVGFISGVVVVGAWIVALCALTPVVWQAQPVSFMVAVGAVFFIVVNNLAEELVYRGYLFTHLGRSYGPLVAAIATSVLFTVLHFQAGVPLPNVIAVVLTSALLYAALFRRWQSVPLVLGVHVGMNVMQEFAGLRHTGLTGFVPVYAHAATARESAIVLCTIATINMALAIAIWLRTPKQT